MGKTTGEVPQGQEKYTDIIHYTGIIPDCIPAPEDCLIDKTQLTYLIGLLLEKYCEDGEIIDADLSTVDITCLISSNSDVVVPDDITIETLATFFKSHICSLYTTISELQDAIADISGLICTNDIVQTDENTPVTIDVLFNDHTTSGTGTVVITIDTPPDNGTVIVDGNDDLVYTPPSGFTGNESVIYKITKGSSECTGKVLIKVNPVTTDDDIADIVQSQIIALLSSNDYWDLGFAIGESIIISKASLMANFTLTGGSPGLGNTGTRYAKWAVCNGYNGTIDYSGVTLRGYKSTDSDYYFGIAGGSDAVGMGLNNLIPHRHGQVYVLRDEEILAAQFSADIQAPVTYASSEADDSGAQDCKYVLTNTGDGTDNINSQDELQATPDDLDVRNAYKTIIIIQKIA